MRCIHPGFHSDANHSVSFVYRPDLSVPSDGSRGAAAAADRNATKVVRVVRVDTPPVIDGRLDEAAWTSAAVIDDFHRSVLEMAHAPSERTEIYLLYDKDALYIAARMCDSGAPARSRATC